VRIDSKVVGMDATDEQVVPPVGFDRLVVGLDATVLQALAAIDAGGANAAVVVDGMERFAGIVTDGDLRRALIGGGRLSDSIRPYVQATALTVAPHVSRAHVLDLMRVRGVNQLPIVDADGRVAGIHRLGDVIGRTTRPNVAVVMAGGRGTRLYPLTQKVPKPMVTVAGRPILEWIVLHLVGAGISRVVLATGYFAEQVEDHFGTGERFGCSIQYVRDPDDAPRGSGGALALVRDALDLPDAPVVVMNGDLITQFDVGAMLDHHRCTGAMVTIAARPLFHEVPFGVIGHDSDHRVTELVEKPVMSWTINAGIYAIEPSLLDRVPSDGEYPITELVGECLRRGEHVSAWDFNDEWNDVGRHDDLARARGIQ
jgi:dTDP-glucose pyrophosphorylase/CBS domain-containing protein